MAKPHSIPTSTESYEASVAPVHAALEQQLDRYWGEKSRTLHEAYKLKALCASIDRLASKLGCESADQSASDLMMLTEMAREMSAALARQIDLIGDSVTARGECVSGPDNARI